MIEPHQSCLLPPFFSFANFSIDWKSIVSRDGNVEIQAIVVFSDKKMIFLEN